MERSKKVLFLIGVLVGTAVICIYTKWHLTVSSSRPTPLSISYALESNTVVKVLYDNISSNREIKHGYILSLKYSGQQGAAMRALASQQCWVGSFGLPMYIVEPFIVNSIVGVSRQGIRNITTVPRLSDYFDSAYFNSQSAKDGFAEVATWDDFLDNAPRNAILVKLSMSPRGKPLIRTSVVWEANATTPCFKNNYIRFLIAHADICITKVVKIPCMTASTKTFTAEEMNTVMFGKYSPNEVTLIFMAWHTPWIIPNGRSNGQNFVCGFDVVLGDKLRPSQKLLRYAGDYKRLYLNAKNSVAVMLRAEHSIYALSKRTGYRKASSANKLAIDSCLREVLNLAQKLHKLVVDQGVFATADVGKFASHTWENTFSKFNFSSQQRAHTIQAVKDTVVALYNNKFTFEEWEESFSKATGGIQDRGYIAALQKTIASQADCLILMGGGNFQRLALQEYLHNHPDKSKQCFHMVCEENLSISDNEMVL